MLRDLGSVLLGVTAASVLLGNCAASGRLTAPGAAALGPPRTLGSQSEPRAARVPGLGAGGEAGGQREGTAQLPRLRPSERCRAGNGSLRCCSLNTLLREPTENWPVKSQSMWHL